MALALVAGDHDHEWLLVARFAGFDFFEDQEAAAAGEHHVEDDQIRRVLLRQLNRLIPVVCGVDNCPGRFEDRLDRREDVLIVIDDEDAFIF